MGQATSESLAASLVADAWKNVLLLGEGLLETET